MGWKTVAREYGIDHIVHVREGNLLLASSFVTDLVVVSPRGDVLKRHDRGDAALTRFQERVEADPEAFARAFAAHDEFDADVPVWTWEGCRIVEHRCEEPGWPNVTHAGALMYDNTFLLDRDEAVEAALENARARETNAAEQIGEAARNLRSAIARHDEAVVDRVALEDEGRRGRVARGAA